MAPVSTPQTPFARRVGGLVVVALTFACGGGGSTESCTTSAECEGDRVCIDRVCVDPGTPDAATPDAAVDAGRDGGSPDAGPCGGECRATQLCRFDTCVPDLGTCATNDDCPGDSYCSGAGECIPYGVPPEVTNDPACERTDVLEEVQPTIQCEWTAPPADDANPSSSWIYSTPIVADLNLDGDPAQLRPSIVVSTWYSGGGDRVGMLRVFDGRTCEEQLQFGATLDGPDRPGYGDQWLVVDLDGDVPAGGRPELVAMHDQGGVFQLYAVALDIDDEGRASARRLWYGRDCESGTPLTVSATDNNGVQAYDLDDDGEPELAIGTMVFDHDGCLLTESETVDPSSFSRFFAHADVDLDGRVELVTGSRIAEWDAATTEWVAEEYFADPGLRPGHVALVDLGQFSTLRGAPAPNQLPEIVVVATERDDFDTGSTGTIRVQTLAGDVIFGPIDLHHSPGEPGGHGGAPTASDFDGDGQVEFAAAANEFYAVYDPDCDDTPDEPPSERPGGRCVRSAAMAGLPAGVLWAQPSQDFSSSVTGSSIFDFNGDGSAEAVYRDECYLRVYDGPSGEVLFSAPASSGTGYDLPIIADVDGDFATEIVVPRTAYSRCPATDPLFAGGASSPRAPASSCCEIRKIVGRRPGRSGTSTPTR